MKNLMLTQKEVLERFTAGCKVVIFDVETTGFRSEDRVIEFSAMRGIVNEQYGIDEVESIDVYINPEIQLPPAIVEFNQINKTGITDEFLADKPLEGDVYDSICDFLSYGILVGYNVGFDIKMMRGMATRLGKTFPYESGFDVLNLARDLLKKPDDVENHKLCTVVAKLCPELDGFHTSSNDVIATANVMTALLRMYTDYIPPNAYDVKLIRARLSYNALTKGNRKIIFQLNIGKDGMVWYDENNQTWNVDSSLVTQVYIPEVQRQFTEVYLKPAGLDNIDDLIEMWYNYTEKVSSKPKKRATKKK